MMRSSKSKIKLLAKQHIESLFNLAHENSNYEQKYIGLLRNYSTKHKVSLPRNIGRSFCKNCNSLFLSNSRVRIKRGKKPLKVITCLKCGSIKRIGLSPKQ
jgi:ribonuclease P protein subunit RPR2